MRLAIYPGSFDPVTNGHIDILEKTCKLFDKIIIAVVHNVGKNALFSLNDRVNLIKESTCHIPNIEVESFSGLLVDYVKQKGAIAIIRGLRTVADFEYEMHIAQINRKMLPEVESIFVLADSRYFFVSSSIIKEVALLGGDVSELVPESVKVGLTEKRQLRLE